MITSHVILMLGSIQKSNNLVDESLNPARFRTSGTRPTRHFILAKSSQLPAFPILHFPAMFSPINHHSFLFPLWRSDSIFPG